MARTAERQLSSEERCIRSFRAWADASDEFKGRPHLSPGGLEFLASLLEIPGASVPGIRAVVSWAILQYVELIGGIWFGLLCLIVIVLAVWNWNNPETE